MNITRHGLKAALVATLLVGLAACGADEAPTTPPDPTESTTESAPEPVEPEAAGETLMTQDSELGTVLADPTGLTLYTFDNDTPGMSACVDECEINWPPVPGEVTAPEGASLPAELTTITRPDGSSQIALDGKPLYTFVKDTEPGQTTGEGLMEVWHAVVLD